MITPVVLSLVRLRNDRGSHDSRRKRRELLAHNAHLLFSKTLRSRLQKAAQRL